MSDLLDSGVEAEYIPVHMKKCDIQRDWRGKAQGMTGLVKNLYQYRDEDTFTDVTFLLPDGSQLYAHKVILALASPVFEAQLFGPLAQKGVDEKDIRDVDSDTFRRMIEFIYMAEDICKIGYYPDANTEDYWRLLEAAHLYILPDLIDVCQNYLCHKLFHYDYGLKKSEELVKSLNEMPRTSICEDLVEYGIDKILRNLPELIDKDLWTQLNSDIQETVLNELGKARFNIEFFHCLRVLHYLTAQFGTNSAKWAGKICRRLQTLVMSSMKDNPAFSLLKFYNGLIDKISIPGLLDVMRSHEEENYVWFKDYYKICDGADDESLGVLCGPLSMHFNDYIINKHAEELRQVLVASTIDDKELTLLCGKIFNWNYDQFWTMLEFGHTHANTNLIDLFELLLAADALTKLYLPRHLRYPQVQSCEELIDQINRASQSPKYKNILHFNIAMLIQRYENLREHSDNTEEYYDNWKQLKKEALDEIPTVYKMMTEVKMEEEELLRVVNTCKENLNS